MHPLTHLYLFHAHVVFSILGFMGFGLMYSLLRNLPPPQKKKASIVLLVIGGIGVVLTVPFCLVALRLMAGSF